MEIHLEPTLLQFLIVLVAAVAASTVVGFRRGWRGQLVAFVPIVATWAVLGAKGEALVNLANTTYKGVLFFTSCSGDTDAVVCAESSGVTTAALVDPSSPDQTRLLFLVVFVMTVLLTFLSVIRFGREPGSVLQKLMGAILGVANGFTLSYLLLPLLPYRQQIPLDLGAATAGENLSGIAPGFLGSISVPNVSVGAGALILFVGFVIVAVRLIRPTGAQQQ